MNRTVLAALTAVLVLAGCGMIRESRLNPFNWFGRSEERVAVPVAEAAADPRALAAEVVSLDIEPYAGGAIIKTTARTPTQGWWDAELVARPVDENGVLVFDFRIFPPLTATPAGTAQSREVTVATAISDIKLDGVTEIVVQGESNARAARR